MDNTPSSILLVPACEKNRGSGHLNRCLSLLSIMEDSGRECYIWIPEQGKEEIFIRFKMFFEASGFSKGFHARLLSDKKNLNNHNWAFIVLDKFRTSKDEFAYWSSLAPLIGIDEGGSYRKHFDFLIDLLPSINKYRANIISPALLPLPKNRRKADFKESDPKKPYRVLISFGGEDSSRLGNLTARAFSERNKNIKNKRNTEITLVSPALVSQMDTGFFNADTYTGVKIIGFIPSLKEHLADYDLLITHFGISAFEAVYARVDVLLISPSSYHEKLTKNAGFIALLKDKINSDTINDIFSPGFLKSLEARRKIIARRYGLEGDQKEDLGGYFSSLDLHSPKQCPVCSKSLKQEDGNNTGFIARFPEESYILCPHCKMIVLCRLKSPPIVYNREYFFEVYKKQYGKTYLEDFPGLVKAGQRRLKHIIEILGSPDELKPRLFDIGCAYGPFMMAAKEAGFTVFGVDPIDDAVDYVNNELQLNAWQGYFPTGVKAEDGPFDSVCLWYVIEHFKDAGFVLCEINRILRKGGVLAFSTPSASGISGRKDRFLFLKNSPSDHWTVWNPKSCKNTLLQYGFRIRKIVITGHHPERFPVLGSLVNKNNTGLLYKFLFLICRIFKLGDTFEVYCEKIQ